MMIKSPLPIAGESELEEYVRELNRATRGGRKRKNYPRVTTRPDLANTFGYDSKGKYIGKPWSQCW